MTFVQLESTCPASLVLGVANTEKPPPLLEIEISLSRNRLKFGGYFLFDDHRTYLEGQTIPLDRLRVTGVEKTRKSTP